MVDIVFYILFAFLTLGTIFYILGLKYALNYVDSLEEPVNQTEVPLKVVEGLVQKAEISPESLVKLDEEFQKLENTIEKKLNEIKDNVNVTEDHVRNTNEAAKALEAVKKAYSEMAGSSTSFLNASEGAKIFHEQIHALTKNLSSLNTLYEIELQKSSNHLKALNQFYGKLQEASASINTTASDAVKAKEQIAALASNLGKLNSIYGNMISSSVSKKDQ